MAPKDTINIGRNCFYSHFIPMDNEHERDENEINYTNAQRASSVDSLEPTDFTSSMSDSLRFATGYRQWLSNDDKLRVDKLHDDSGHQRREQVTRLVRHDDEDSLQQKTLSTSDLAIITKTRSESEEEIDNDEYSLSHMDVSFNQVDLQLHMNHDQTPLTSRYQGFSSTLGYFYQTAKLKLVKDDSAPHHPPPDMDMENGGDHRSHHNGHSQQQKQHYNNGFSGPNRQSNGSSNGHENGYNPNRNDKNSRRPNDDRNGDDDPDDNDDHDDDGPDDDDDDDQSDESLARRLGFSPLDDETIRTIGRLRRLTNKQFFDRRDFENLQSLLDELIQHQHLENFSRPQLKRIVHSLRLHRPLRTKSRAFTFLQERIPHRAVKYNVISTHSVNNGSVFDIWRERERRSRLDSKDSLEDDGQHLREVHEVNYPTPPVFVSHATTNVASKVKQMAKDIDTKSVSSRAELTLHTADRLAESSPHVPSSSSPTYSSLVSIAVYDVKPRDKSDGRLNGSSLETRLSGQPLNSVSSTQAEQNRVRQLINRLESSSSTPSTMVATKRISIKKPLHDDHSDGSTSLTSSPPVKRVARRENHSTNGTRNGHDTTLPHSQNGLQNEIRRRDTHANREEVTSRGQRTTSGTTIEEYVTPLLPETETSVSMVRDVRARVFDDDDDDDAALSRIDVETMAVKVDVETLYILEQKSDRKAGTHSSNVNLYISDREPCASPTRERLVSPQNRTVSPHRPMDTQSHSPIIQTSDTLHRLTNERPRLPSSSSQHDGEGRKVITPPTRYEIKRRRSSHQSSLDGDDGAAVIHIDEKSTRHGFEDNFQLKREQRHSSTDEPLPIVPEQRPSFGQITSRIRIDQLRDINRHVVRRHLQEKTLKNDEHRSSEVYEIHTRGACKCLVISLEEKAQNGFETRFEKQLRHIEVNYTEKELQSTELHVVVTSSDRDYLLVKRTCDLQQRDSHDDKENERVDDKAKQPTISIHYYNRDGQRLKTEYARCLEQLPLVVRCEIEYELNHYGSAQLIILSVTNAERRQMNTSLKNELVDEIVSRSNGRLSAQSPELEQEILRQLAEPTKLQRLADYSSRDDYPKAASSDLRRVSRIDVTTSLRLVQRYRTVIHRLCQLYRSQLRLSIQAESQRYLLLVARDEYYLLDLTSQISTNISHIRQRQHDIFKREVNNALQQPFDYVKYRREAEQEQKRLGELKYQRTKVEPPPPGHPSEAEFYLGSQRRVLIEREIRAMRQSIRPHEQAPPRFKHEPFRRSSTISYSSGQRYTRARIIHVKDFFDDVHPEKRQAREQELFVRVDDFINEAAANSLRRSYSTDYLQENGPCSRVRCLRIPGETIKIEEKTTHEYQGIMYANLPYSLRYWNILYILDREARKGRPLGSSLPQVIVNDPYRALIPPLTQQEIHQTAQQLLSSPNSIRSPTDQTLRWFLSRDNRTEIESAKYLQTLDHYRSQHEQQAKQRTDAVNHRQGDKTTKANKCFVTETLVRYEKLPDRLITVPVNDRVPSTDNLTPYPTKRSKSQSSSRHPSVSSSPAPVFLTSPHDQRTLLPSMHSPLSRHQSVDGLHASSPHSRPPSPSPSLHSLHSSHQQRRPVAFHNRFPMRSPSQKQDPLFTEIIDSQTGQRLLTTSQEQLPTEVLGLLHRYNLQQF